MCVDMSVYVYEQYEETGLFWREKGKKKKKAHTRAHMYTHEENKKGEESRLRKAPLSPWPQSTEHAVKASNSGFS